MPSPSAPAPLPALPEGLEGLAALALDLRWTYGEDAERIWAELDPEVWDLTRNPWLILQTVSRERLEAAARSPGFRERVAAEARRAGEGLAAPTWFARTYPDGGEALTAVAYFSMEFGLNEALPIYSGGLGVLAGDHLKAASDLGVPVIGVGLLYQRGYFRQALDPGAAQTELYPYNEPSQLPIAPVWTAEGERLRLRFQLPGRTIWVRVWEVRVGRVRLYLLDTNDPLNVPVDRGVASELYGGGPELRLQQELLLGIAGWQLLRRLGLCPEVCHLNEGHAAFAILERARCHMEDAGGSFAAALAATRAGNVFTTHTPVAAGFDRFAPELVARYLTPYAQQLGIGLDQLLALGRLRPDDPGEPLNMAYLALRGSGAANGVSRLHGEVSRRLFQPLFPRWPAAEVPVGHVTNGAHTPSWASPGAHRFLDESIGRGWGVKLDHNFGDPLDQATDPQLWAFRGGQRAEFVGYVRRRYARQRGAEGASPREIVEAGRVLDPNALTLGLARRFATYKRPTLLLVDPDRLARILTDPHRPVQIVVAGKAHPQDHAGKALVQAWARFSRRPRVRDRVVFLSDYDMLLARNLVRGVDVWLNTPRRPWEASGTSGMKVLVNGGLNLSSLDGWWAEAHDPEVGWAIGDGREHGDDPAWDARDAESLYGLLEREIVPAFYDHRDEEGLPRAWIARMRASMVRLAPHFSAARMVQEYADRYYLPAARGHRRRVADGGAGAAEVLAWQEALERYWHELRFGEVRVVEVEGGGAHRFEAQVYLGGLHPDAVAVELFALSPEGDAAPPVRLPMTRCHPLGGAIGGYLYAAEAPPGRPPSDCTPRIVPRHPHAAVPAENRLILWER